ncbi:MAG: DUF4041 domain-containing protein [Acidimicrobiales bacterium]
MNAVPAGWHPDPARRHQFRWWDGSQWTAHVSDNGVAGVDPPQAPAARSDAGQAAQVPAAAVVAAAQAGPTGPAHLSQSSAQSAGIVAQGVARAAGASDGQRTASGERVVWEGVQNRGRGLGGTRWVLTDDTLEIHAGRLNHSLQRVPLADVAAVRLSRGMLERAAGVGDIALDVVTDQGTIATLVMDNVPDPEVVEGLLQRLRVAAGERRQVAQASGEVAQLRSAIAAYSHTVDLIDAGLYQRRHVLDDAAAYQAELKKIADSRAAMVKAGTAVAGNDQASAQAKSVGKLALRAYNGAVDQLTYKLRPYRLEAALAKLDRERDTIDRMLRPFDLRLSIPYHRASRKEIELTADFVDAKEREREALRARREELREAEKVERQLAAERARLAKEREHYLRALAAAQASGHASAEDLSGLQAKLAELETRRRRSTLGRRTPERATCM